jgi:formylglycine-generating enzyme required for sulfatase activity
MGSPESEPGRSGSEGPQRGIRLARGLAMGQTELTVADFRLFVEATGFITDAEKSGWSTAYQERSGRVVRTRQVSWRENYKGDAAKDKLPVLHVSFNDASAYAAWLSQQTGQRYRLPTEAEFEYALRAGTQSLYWWGDGTPNQMVENLTGQRDRSRSKREWNIAFAGYGDGYWGPAPVRSFQPNPFGLYDLGGNVSEWVEDCWHDSYARAPEDSSAWVNPGCVRRVLRGGSWGSPPEQSRSAYRQGVSAENRGSRIGFRLVREL